MDPTALRAEFPVLERIAYLNAGTDGPLPARAVTAAGEELDRALRRGRAKEHFERRKALAQELREQYARLLACDSADVALTTSTSEGIATVVAGLPLAPGDELLTSDEEHPGLQGPLAAARDDRGAVVRVVPFAELAGAVTERTRLVACSHVSWMSGSVVPAALAESGVPVLLDGAQGVGAVPTDVHALGCSAYAGSGQKWCCGPDGIGMLFVAPALRERLAVARRGYGNLGDPSAGLDGGLQPDARRFDAPAISAETLACALAAVAVLAGHGWSEVHERGAALARTLAQRLREAGREVVARDDTTLVSFSSPDAESERERLAESGVVLRNIPGRPRLRASVGAWNDEGDLARLLETLAR